MDFLDLARTRRSVRNYLEKEVDENLLLKVLEAGRLAPSACNNQPWVFIVIRDKESRRRLESVYGREWFLRAPVIVAVCCDRRSSWRRSDGKDFGDIDIAIAVDHMTLAAAEAGLGTCWIGNFNPANARAVLMLPQHIDPVVFTPIGYPDQQDLQKKTRREAAELIHWEFFGGKKR